MTSSTEKFPKLSLGTCTMGSQLNEKESLELLDHAYDTFRFRFYDTAEGYPTVMRPVTHGNTEMILGEWIAKNNPPDLLINTKIFGPGNVFRGGKTTLESKEMRAALNGSLERMHIENVTCYMLHWTPTDHDTVQEVVGAMKEFLDEKKIATFGLSNASYEAYEKYLQEAEKIGIEGPALVQNRFSYQIDPQGVEEAPVPLMAYGVLRYGSYTGKYQNGVQDQKSRLPWLRDNFGWDITDMIQSKHVDDLMAECGNRSPAHYAIEYVLEKPFVKNVILGFTSKYQMDETMADLLVA